METARIKYVGNKPLKLDNVAGTGLAWKPGQSHDVEITKAGQLLKFPGVWELDVEKKKRSKPESKDPEQSSDLMQEAEAYHAKLLEIAEKLGVLVSSDASVHALEEAIEDKKSQMDADQIRAALGEEEA